MGRQFDFFGGDETQHNVFFAALLDATTISRSGETARDVCRHLGLSGAPLPAERLHVSLRSVGGFSGSCSPSVIAAATRAADTVSLAPFNVEFDRVSSFSASRGQRALVLTGGGDRVVGFMRLKDALEHALMKAGLKLPRQSNFSPHLTMMYVEDSTFDIAIEPIGWTVSRFALVDSLVGQSRHVHLGQWLL